MILLGSFPTSFRNSSSSSPAIISRYSMISFRCVCDLILEMYLFAEGQFMLATTATTDGLESSRGCGWVTSAPMNITGSSSEKILGIWHGKLLYKAILQPPSFALIFKAKFVKNWEVSFLKLE
uniref:Uncharacterized protein n=1 Tax=Oryza brachyantha TaxID=4533 RepID=J3LQ68_ORYBR